MTQPSIGRPAALENVGFHPRHEQVIREAVDRMRSAIIRSPQHESLRLGELLDWIGFVVCHLLVHPADRLPYVVWMIDHDDQLDEY